MKLTLWFAATVFFVLSLVPVGPRAPEPPTPRIASALFYAGQPDGGGEKSIVHSSAHPVPPGMARIILADRGGGLGFNGQALPEWTDTDGDFDPDLFRQWAQGRVLASDTVLLDVEREDWLGLIPDMARILRDDAGCRSVGFYASPLLAGAWPTGDAILIAGAKIPAWEGAALAACDFVSPCIYPFAGEGVVEFRRRIAAETLVWRMLAEPTGKRVRPIGSPAYHDPGGADQQYRAAMMNAVLPIEYVTAQAQVMHAAGGGVWWGGARWVVWHTPAGDTLGLDGSLPWAGRADSLPGIVRHFEAAAQESAATAPLTP